MSYRYIPPPLKSSRHIVLDIRYTIRVVQNPIRARCCGFGEKDRRPIDPPPILELSAEDRYGNRIDLKPEDTTLFLVQCELYDADKNENRTLVYTPWSTTLASSMKDQQNADNSNNINSSNSNSSNSNHKQKVVEKPEYVKNLIGASVSNAYHLYNEHDKAGIYFIFHDLSVRTEGSFTLKFVFFNLAAGEPWSTNSHVEQEVFSTVFSVYTAKKFPGLTDSTSLSRCFSKQGIKIPIRNEAQSKRIHRNSDTIMKEQHFQYQDDHLQEQQLNSTTQPKYTRLPISDFLLPPEE